MPMGLPGTAGEIDVDLARLGVDGHRGLQRDDVAARHVELAFAMKSAGRQLADRLPGATVGARDDLVGNLVDVA